MLQTLKKNQGKATGHTEPYLSVHRMICFPPKERLKDIPSYTLPKCPDNQRKKVFFSLFSPHTGLFSRFILKFAVGNGRNTSTPHPHHTTTAPSAHPSYSMHDLRGHKCGRECFRLQDSAEKRQQKEESGKDVIPSSCGPGSQVVQQTTRQKAN